jgi:hypothetical protein
MSYYYGTVSRGRLNTCHSLLQQIAEEGIRYRDIAVLCGHRPEEAQTAAFVAGNSKKKWPESEHNSLPSAAIDMCPWPEPRPMKDFLRTARPLLAEAFEFGGFILGIANTLSIQLRWGGHWREPFDSWHFELVKGTYNAE